MYLSTENQKKLTTVIEQIIDSENNGILKRLADAEKALQETRAAASRERREWQDKHQKLLSLYELQSAVVEEYRKKTWLYIEADFIIDGCSETWDSWIAWVETFTMSELEWKWRQARQQAIIDEAEAANKSQPLQSPPLTLVEEDLPF